MPAENAADLDDIPSEVMDELNFHLVHDLDEVMEIALLGEAPRPHPSVRSYTIGEQAHEGVRAPSGLQHADVADAFLRQLPDHRCDGALRTEISP